MGKYPISREFFPFSHFTPPISEKFLAIAVPNMKTPKFIFRAKELDTVRYEIESYDGEDIEVFLMSPKAAEENAPCLPRGIIIKMQCFMQNRRGAKCCLSTIVLHQNTHIPCFLKTAMPQCAGCTIMHKHLALIIPVSA